MTVCAIVASFIPIGPEKEKKKKNADPAKPVRSKTSIGCKSYVLHFC